MRKLTLIALLLLQSCASNYEKLQLEYQGLSVCCENLTIVEETQSLNLDMMDSPGFREFFSGKSLFRLVQLPEAKEENRLLIHSLVSPDDKGGFHVFKPVIITLNEFRKPIRKLVPKIELKWEDRKVDDLASAVEAAYLFSDVIIKRGEKYLLIFTDANWILRGDGIDINSKKGSDRLTIDYAPFGLVNLVVQDYVPPKYSTNYKNDFSFPIVTHSYYLKKKNLSNVPMQGAILLYENKDLAYDKVWVNLAPYPDVIRNSEQEFHKIAALGFIKELLRVGNKDIGASYEMITTEEKFYQVRKKPLSVQQVAYRIIDGKQQPAIGVAYFSRHRDKVLKTEVILPNDISVLDALDMNQFYEQVVSKFIIPGPSPFMMGVRRMMNKDRYSIDPSQL